MPRVPHTRFDKVPGCSVEATLSLIGGKWKGVLLHHLFQNGTMRFNELKRALPAITQRMLTNQLRELESNGLILREVFAVVPPRVEYSLSDRGMTLRPVMEALDLWGTLHFKYDPTNLISVYHASEKTSQIPAILDIENLIPPLLSDVGNSEKLV